MAVITFLFVLGLLVMFVVGLIRLFAIGVSAYNGAVLCNLLTGRYRPVGPGMHFCIPFIEYVAGSCSIRERVLSGEMEAETQDEVPIPLSFFLEWRPDPNRLTAYIGFDEADIERALVGRFKSIATTSIRFRKRFEEVYNSLDVIAREIHRDFTEARGAGGRTLEDHYGIIVSAIRFSDPKVPDKIVQAKLDLEAARRTNQRHTIELQNLEAMAQGLMQRAIKNKQSLPFQTAIRIVQARLGIIKEDVRTFGLSQETLNVVERFLE